MINNNKIFEIKSSISESTAEKKASINEVDKIINKLRTASEFSLPSENSMLYRMFYNYIFERVKVVLGTSASLEDEEKKIIASRASYESLSVRIMSQMGCLLSHYTHLPAVTKLEAFHRIYESDLIKFINDKKLNEKNQNEITTALKGWFEQLNPPWIPTSVILPAISKLTADLSYSNFDKSPEGLVREIIVDIYLITLWNAIQDAINSYSDGGICEGTVLSLMSALPKKNSPKFLQICYSLSVLEAKFASEDLKDFGSQIAKYHEFFPSIIRKTSYLLNCNPKEVLNLRNEERNLLLGRIAVSNIFSRRDLDLIELGKLQTLLKTNPELNKLVSIDKWKKISKIVNEHPRLFPFINNSNLTTKIYFDLMEKNLPEIEEDLIGNLQRYYNQEPRIENILHHLGIESTGLIMLDTIENLPNMLKSAYEKYGNESQGRFTLALRGKSSHALFLNLSHGNLQFADSNDYDPITLQAIVRDFNDIDGLIRYVTLAIANEYESVDFKTCALILYRTLPSSHKQRMTQLRSQLQQLDNFRLSRNKMLSKLVQREQKMQTSEITELLAKLTESIEIIRNQLKPLVIEAILEYTDKIAKLSDSEKDLKQRESYEKVIESYYYSLINHKA